MFIRQPPEGGEFIMELSLAVKYVIPANDLADSLRHPSLYRKQ
ncbi:hypothetical protein [Christiangramia sp.]|nr:hypothetical protein [Christiangramia sp.]